MPDVAAVITATFASSFPMAGLLSYLLDWCVRPLTSPLSAEDRVIRNLAETAAYPNEFASNPLGVAGGEEGSYAGDVVPSADAAERSLCDGILLEVRTDEPSGVHTFGLDH